jgi:micrococcal nuclease
MNKRAQLILILIIILVIIAIILLIFAWPTLTKEYQATNTEKCTADNCVERVVDGDTFMLRTGEYVRLICVNTPERTDTGYFEATKFLRDLIEGKPVRLEKDVSEIDKYNRLLRYVYINVTNSSGAIREIFINRELVQQGLAVIWRYPPDIKRCNEIAGVL